MVREILAQYWEDLGPGDEHGQPPQCGHGCGHQEHTHNTHIIIWGGLGHHCWVRGEKPAGKGSGQGPGGPWEAVALDNLERQKFCVVKLASQWKKSSGL